MVVVAVVGTVTNRKCSLYGRSDWESNLRERLVVLVCVGRNADTPCWLNDVEDDDVGDDTVATAAAVSTETYHPFDLAIIFHCQYDLFLFR